MDRTSAPWLSRATGDTSSPLPSLGSASCAVCETTLPWFGVLLDAAVGGTACGASPVAVSTWDEFASVVVSCSSVVALGSSVGALPVASGVSSSASGCVASRALSLAVSGRLMPMCAAAFASPFCAVSGSEPVAAAAPVALERDDSCDGRDLRRDDPCQHVLPLPCELIRVGDGVHDGEDHSVVRDLRESVPTASVLQELCDLAVARRRVVRLEPASKKPDRSVRIEVAIVERHLHLHPRVRCRRYSAPPKLLREAT